LLLGYYTPEGELVYAGRVGTGMPGAELERLWQRLHPLAVTSMPLSAPPPRGGRFGSPLVLSRVHWVRPEMVVEVSYASTAAELAQIYSRPALFAGASVGFNDIDSGTCGMAATGVFDTYLATPGWDFCSGVGSPLGYFGK
jgi:ATP dependent DNA ligase C terminal region